MMRSTMERGPITLQCSRELSAWIEAGGPPERQVLLRGLRHRWSGMWFEHLAKAVAGRCAGVELPSDPVFIVGLWRTGSTVLHTTLSRETRWTTPRTWQCFRPAHFLLMPPPARREAVRPMDAGVIDTFSPQEDEFAALLLGEPSTYRGFIDPRRMDELGVLLDQWNHANSVENAPLSNRWECFLRAVMSGSSGRLLLKSPNHTFRVQWLAKRFPDARFIWLVRRPADVLESNRRMWAAMVQRYGQWRLDSAALERFLDRALRNHDDLLDWARCVIADRLFVAEFEDVISARLTGPILDFLALSTRAAD